MAKKPPKKGKKPAKKGGKPALDDLSEMEQLVARGRAAVEAQMAGLEALIEDIGKDSNGQETLRDKAVAATNSLTKSMVALSAEQRQLEKHTKLNLDRLTSEQEDAIVMEYLQEIPRPRRNKFLEALKDLDGNNDLLAL